MARLRVEVKSYLVSEETLEEAAADAASTLRGMTVDTDEASIRYALALPAWVGVPTELVHRVKHLRA